MDYYYFLNYFFLSPSHSFDKVAFLKGKKSSITSCLAAPSTAIRHGLSTYSTQTCHPPMTCILGLFCPQTAELQKYLEQKRPRSLASFICTISTAHLGQGFPIPCDFFPPLCLAICSCLPVFPPCVHFFSHFRERARVSLVLFHCVTQNTLFS